MKHANEMFTPSLTPKVYFWAILLVTGKIERAEARQIWQLIHGEMTKMYDELAALLFL